MDFVKYRHYPLKLALKESKQGEKQRFRVTTINWTFATIRGKRHYEQVHKNEYSWTLRNLIKFIRKTEEVAEDVIAIRPEPKPVKQRKNRVKSEKPFRLPGKFGPPGQRGWMEGVSKP